MPVQGTYDGPGSQTDFTVPFDYTSRAFVDVVVGVTPQVLGTDYEFISDSTIRFTVAPGVGTDNVIFTRNTDITPLLVDFTPGSSILDTDLDTAILQVLHVAEERASEGYVDAAVAAATLDPTTPVSAFGATLIDDSSAAVARSTLGAGATGGSLFTASNIATAYAVLGFPAYFQLFLAAATSADAARSYLNVTDDVPRENVCVNSDFQVWQHGTNFSGGTLNADDSYTADQWILLTENNDVVDIDKTIVPDEVPDRAKGALKATVQTDNEKFALFQPIEAAVVEPNAGDNWSLSLEIKTGGNNTLTDFDVHLIAWSQTADSITSDAILTWNAATADPALAVGWGYVASGSAAVTANNSTWTKVEIEDANVLSSANNLGILIVSNDGAFTATAEVYISKVKLEPGDKCTPYVSKSFSEEWGALTGLWEFDKWDFNKEDETLKIMLKQKMNAATP